MIHPIRLALAVQVALLAPTLMAQAPPVQPFSLSSGLNCILVESHDRPLVRMELVSRWDPAGLPSGKEGLTGFLALAMAAGGAGPYTSASFHQALDDLGMDLGFDARMGAFQWTLTADSRSQEAAMELLADAVVRPVIDGPLVETQRQMLIKRSSLGSPRERGIARFLWNLGDPATLLPPGQAGVDRIEYQNVLDFRRWAIRPEHSVLALYGDLNLAQAKQLVLMHLGIWGPIDQPPVPGSPLRAGARAGKEPRLLAVFEPGPGAELWAGAPRPQQGCGPAETALLPILLARAARSFFGGFAMSFQLAPGGESLLIKAKVPSAQRDLLAAGVTAGLDRLRRSGFSIEDLGCAVIQWKAENAALPLHPGALLRRMLEGRLEPALARSVERVTLKDLDQALNAWLEPERVRFLLLGADAPMLQSAEKAGLTPSLILGADDSK